MDWVSASRKNQITFRIFRTPCLELNKSRLCVCLSPFHHIIWLRIMRAPCSFPVLISGLPACQAIKRLCINQLVISSSPLTIFQFSLFKVDEESAKNLRKNSHVCISGWFSFGGKERKLQISSMCEFFFFFPSGSISFCYSARHLKKRKS